VHAAPRRRRSPGGSWLAFLGFVLAIVAPILAFIVAVVLFGQGRTRAGFGVIGVALVWLAILVVAYVNAGGSRRIRPSQ